MVDLQEAAKRKLNTFSKGMIQRIGLAMALLPHPSLVFLDEPMSGLDPIGRRHVRTLILALRDRGATVFFSSHILADAEAVCSRVGIIAHGKLVAEGTAESLRAQAGAATLEDAFIKLTGESLANDEARTEGA